MSKRLQVILADDEMSAIQKLASAESLTVGEWVRRSLREAREQKPSTSAEAKLRAVRRSAELSFPVADLDQMLSEIEQGYQG